MKTTRSGHRMLQHEQVFDHPFEDAYRESEKLPEPSHCPSCDATYVKGRWTWQKAPADAAAHTCPACRRIHDHFPAGYLTLKGRFAPEQRERLLALVRAREARAKAEHPLQRIISIDDVAGGIRVTTTDGHLARGIGRAVRDAFRGSLEIKFAPDDHLVRAIWRAGT